jgi:hypothetical protein
MNPTRDATIAPTQLCACASLWTMSGQPSSAHPLPDPLVDPIAQRFRASSERRPRVARCSRLFYALDKFVRGFRALSECGEVIECESNVAG